MKISLSAIFPSVILVQNHFVEWKFIGIFAKFSSTEFQINIAFLEIFIFLSLYPVPFQLSLKHFGQIFMILAFLSYLFKKYGEHLKLLMFTIYCLFYKTIAKHDSDHSQVLIKMTSDLNKF